MTLDEIFKNGIDPTIKVSHPSYGAGSYFIFFFKNADNYYYGLNSNQQAIGYNGNTIDWEIWTEPKKKVMMAQYLVMPASGACPWVTSYLFKDDEAFLKFHKGITDMKWFKRLEEIECEE